MKALLHHLLCPELGCGKKYLNKVQLNVHLLQQHQIEAFRCKIRGCTVSYASQIELSDHRKLAHSHLRSLPCGQCEMSFPLYRQLYSHSWLTHETGQFGCHHGRCTFTATTRIKVDNHQWTHRHRATVHRCTFAACMETFSSRRSLKAHLRAHEPNKREKKTLGMPSKAYACPVCKLQFSRKRDSLLHKLTHLTVTFHCKWPACDYASDLAACVSKHVRGRHLGLRIIDKENGNRIIIGHRNVGEFIERKMKTTAN